MESSKIWAIVDKETRSLVTTRPYPLIDGYELKGLFLIFITRQQARDFIKITGNSQEFKVVAITRVVDDGS